MEEIEQVRVEQRRDDVLQDDRCADPCDRSRTAKQSKVRRPHRGQDGCAENPELDKNAEDLIVRIAGDWCGSIALRGLPVLCGGGSRPVPENGR